LPVLAATAESFLRVAFETFYWLVVKPQGVGALFAASVALTVYVKAGAIGGSSTGIMAAVVLVVIGFGAGAWFNCILGNNRMARIVVCAMAGIGTFGMHGWLITSV